MQVPKIGIRERDRDRVWRKGQPTHFKHPNHYTSQRLVKLYLPGRSYFLRALSFKLPLRSKLKSSWGGVTHVIPMTPDCGVDVKQQIK